jgi:S1-C subfamily serine protease
MGWVKGTVIAAGVLTATAALAAYEGSVTRGAHPESRRERSIVSPQIEVFASDRAQLGVALRDLDEASAKEHKLTAAEGALVDRVEPGSAAETAGIKSGDVIVSFDGERVRSVRQLQRLVGDTPPGRAVKVGVVRDGRKTEMTATLGKGSGRLQLPGGGELRFDDLEGSLDQLRNFPRAFRREWRDDQVPGDLAPLPRAPREFGSPFSERWRFPFNGWTSGAGRLGVVVQELTPQLGEHFGSKDGILVASVSEGSPAEQAGFKAGDVITTVNGKPVNDVDDLLRAVHAQPDGEEMTVGVVRDRQPQTLKVKLLSATRTRPI